MNYQKYYDKAFSKVQKYGSPIVVKRLTGESEYNPDTDEYEETFLEITGVALRTNFEQKDIDGTNIKFSDAKFMAVLNGTPETNDKIEFAGKAFVVINARPLNLNGQTDIYWTIQAR